MTIKRNNKPDLKAGISLIEILIAFAIFTCAVIPFVNILSFSSRANIKSIYAIQASNLALSQMEQLKHGSSVLEVPPFKAVYTGYAALQYLIVQKTGTSADWAEYTKTIAYGKIPGYPNYKMDISISFFPVKTFKIVNFPPMIMDDASGLPTAVTQPKEEAEYEKLTSRIQINVTVSWIEPENKKELSFKAFTIVTKP
ncbi:MAG TPA: hypothetical protein PKK26_14365 [Candidatus Wallbacteria bacterium]|nr:hypothetical protein [Candidatus Wallbacteria bacterium]